MAHIANLCSALVQFIFFADANCPGGLDDLRVQLMWSSQPQFAGFQIPNSRDVRLPSYKDECLRVRVQPGGPDWVPLEELSSGRVDVALSNGIEVIRNIMSGMNLTIIHHSFRGNPFRLVSLRNSSLQGGKIGVWCCGNEYTSKAMVHFEVGLANVTFVDQGFSMGPLYSGQVHAASAMSYNEVGRVLQQVNPVTKFLYQYDEVHVWDPNAYPVPELHQVVVVDSGRLAELRPKLLRFLKVVNKAWIACRDQEEICMSHYPGSDQAHTGYMMREINRLNFPSPMGLGVLPRAAYDRMMKFSVELELITSPPSFDKVANMSLVLQLHQDPSVFLPYNLPRINFCAPYGSSVYSICKAWEHTLCPAGSEPAGLTDGNCTLCPSGKFSFEPMSPVRARMLTCEGCPAGRFVSVAGATSCELCPAGLFAYEGQVVCAACPSGRSTDGSKGAPECSVCVAGRFSSARGSARCKLCDKGMYQEAGAAAACEPCGGGMTTDILAASNRSQCACDVGTYFKHNSLADATGIGTCTQCESFLLCPGGFSPHGHVAPDLTVQVTSGYMAMQLPGDAGKLTVFRCVHPEACKGTRQVFQAQGVVDKHMCQGNHALKPGCATCMEGYYAYDGRCSACDSVMSERWSAEGVFVLYATCLCAILYHKSMFPPNPINMAWGTLISFAQVLFLATRFLTIPTMPQHCIEPLGFLEFDFALFGLSADCASQDFMYRFVIKLSWPVFLLCGFALLPCISVIFRTMVQLVLRREIASPVELVPQNGLIRRLFNKAEVVTKKSHSGIPCSERLMWYWRGHLADLKNAMVKTANGLFIVLTTTALTIFRFTEHPSGIKTVSGFPDVFEGSEAWYAALPWSILELAIVTVSFFAFVVYLVLVAPRRVSNDPDFRRSFRCLWMKFDPGAWWFCVVHLLYALVLNIAPVITTGARLQMFVQVLSNVCYVLALCHGQPWRYELNHWVDILTKMGYTCFVLVLFLFEVEAPLNQNQYGAYALIPLILALVCVLAVISKFIWYHEVAKVRDLAMRAEFSQRLSDIIKLAGARDTLELRAYAIGLLDNDVQRVDKALDAIQFTLLGLQSKHWWRWRVAPVPFEVAIDGRLEGEMQAKGLLSSTDVRVELRQFRAAFFDDNEQSVNDSQTSKIRHLARLESRFGGVSSRMRAVFDTMDSSHVGKVSKTEFTNRMHEWSKSEQGLQWNEKTLGKIFDYMDIDQSGYLSAEELCEGLLIMPEPVRAAAVAVAPAVEPAAATEPVVDGRREPSQPHGLTAILTKSCSCEPPPTCISSVTAGVSVAVDARADLDFFCTAVDSSNVAPLHKVNL